ncbi:MAG: class I SAM-dependent methyltransferase [Chitinophagaceae bacterium]
MPSVPERFTWAMSFLPIKSHHQVLEIGCGNGILAQLIAGKLKTGSLLGIDQSAYAITQARKRNEEAIRQQKARFECCAVKDLKLIPETYDLITAFNTAFLWKASGTGIQILAHALKVKGILCLFYQTPYPITLAEAAPIKHALIRHKLSIETLHLEKLATTTVLALTASRKA